MTQTVIIATTNENKLKEFRQMLDFDKYQVTSLKDYPQIEDIEETGSTFDENAAIKADYVSQLFPDAIVIADDSGLCVNALNGEPGVRSARYASDHDDVKNVQAVLDKLNNVVDRSAYYVTSMAIRCQNQPELNTIVQGKLHGIIATEQSTIDGFAYDVVFIPNGYYKPLSELGLNVKNNMSHRKLAMEQVIKKLESAGK